MCSCHSILECCVTFSGVKLSIRSFVLFIITLGSHILSRSMEADILKSKKDPYLVQKYGGRYFAKVKRTDILSRSMEADILESKKDLYLVQKYGGQYV